MSRPTPETKWYVTEYPEECSFAITDGNEILVTIIGGNTIGDQCDLASRIAKLPDLERELDEAREEIRDWKRLHDSTERGVDLTIAEGTISDLLKQRDECAAMCGRYKQERDEAREQANVMHEQWLSKDRWNVPSGISAPTE